MKKLTILMVLVLALALGGCAGKKFHEIIGLPEPGFLLDDPEAANAFLMMQQNQILQQQQQPPQPRVGTILAPNGQTYYYYGN